MKIVDSDYWGARNAGMNALLLRRLGPEGEHAHKEPSEQLNGVHIVANMNSVVDWVNVNNSTS